MAIIAANPALSSILGMMLAADPGLRVRQFESRRALEIYMRLSPVDLIVADFDCAAAPADQLAEALRGNEALAQRDFQVIALAHTVTSAMKHASVRAGISEVVVKPMSPRYLLDRVLSRLRHVEPQVAAPTGYRGPERRNRLSPGEAAFRGGARRGDNVVQLFPAGAPA